MKILCCYELLSDKAPGIFPGHTIASVPHLTESTLSETAKIILKLAEPEHPLGTATLVWRSVTPIQ